MVNKVISAISSMKTTMGHKPFEIAIYIIPGRDMGKAILIKYTRIYSKRAIKKVLSFTGFGRMI
jgi:hypothetical protein